MTDVDFAGTWEGTLHGTNQGRVYLKILQHDSAAELDVRISDYNLGTYALAGTGQVVGDTLRSTLSPRQAPPHLALGRVTGTVKLSRRGELSGEWESEAGTAGAFIAQRVPSSDQSASTGAMKTAFVMMRVAPSDPEAEDVLAAIKSICAKLGLEAVRSDDVEHSGKITDVILDRIRSKELLICDLTTERPNVYYELGFAHGLERPVILLAKEGSTIHFDIKDYNVIFYRNMVALQGKLESRIKSMMTDTSSS